MAFHIFILYIVEYYVTMKNINMSELVYK